MGATRSYCLTCEGKVVYLGGYKSYCHDYMVYYMSGTLSHKDDDPTFLNKAIFQVWSEGPKFIEYEVNEIRKFYKMGIINASSGIDELTPKELGIKANSGQIYAYSLGYNHFNQDKAKSPYFNGYLF